MYTHVTAALFTIWEIAQMFIYGGWISKSWPIHTMDYYSVKRKKWSTHTHYENEPWKHDAKWKKLDTKGHILYDYVYKK